MTDALALPDLIVIGIYFVAIAAIGVWSAKKVHNIADFIMPRRFGKMMMLMHSFGTGTHSDQAVSVASKSFTSGLSGIWYQWLWLFCTPFYWLIAPVMRRFRALTTADVFAARYDRSVAGLFAVVGLLNFAINIGVMLKGSSDVIDACTDGAVNADWAIAGMTVLFVIYGVAGGLGAAIITDFIQGVLTIIFSFLLLPYILDAVGGMTGLHAQLPEIAPGKDMMSLVAPGDISVFYITVISFNALVGIVTQPHTMGNCAAGRTELDGQVGLMGGTLVKRLCTIAWCLTGLAAVVYFAGEDVDPGKVYGHAAREILPTILPGALGLFIAALLASVMSSCDSFMIASSGLFTENCYKPLRPGQTEKHYLLVARLSSLVVVAGGIVFAYQLEDVVHGLEIFWKIAPMMGIAFWLGLFWRRTTIAGAWAATLGAFFMWWATEQTFVLAPLAEIEGMVNDDGHMSLPWQMIAYLTFGTFCGIAVSLFTKPINDERLDRFYALVRTPVIPGEQPDVPCTLPDDAQVPEPRYLTRAGGLEILMPSARGFAGFIVGWLCVAAIIGGFAWWVYG